MIGRRPMGRALTQGALARGPVLRPESISLGYNTQHVARSADECYVAVALPARPKTSSCTFLPCRPRFLACISCGWSAPNSGLGTWKQHDLIWIIAATCFLKLYPQHKVLLTR